MESIIIDKELTPEKKNTLILYVNSLGGKVGFHEELGMYINTPNKKTKKLINIKIEELQNEI